MELEEQLAASATSQRLQDDLDRLDAGAFIREWLSQLACVCVCGYSEILRVRFLVLCWQRVCVWLWCGFQ